MNDPKDIDDYIRNESASIQKILRTVRSLVKKTAPKASEKIAWGMPTFYLEGNLLHFAAFQNHMSIFPGADAIVYFKKELVRYTTSKGTIQIPYDEKIPVALVKKIVKFCMKRNLARAATKKKLARKKKTRGSKKKAR
jgi:uncharacterized protein YdhG (YjbR/CyaY superfamily)